MASSFGAKSRQPATSSPPASSRFSGRSSTVFSRPYFSKSATAFAKSSSSAAAEASSVRFSGGSISVQKNRDNNANPVLSKKKKTCMCSPTTHPGSFRCSLHKNCVNGADYRKFRNEPFQSSRSTLNFRRLAMKNSIVRIGGRALSALIRPSSHQQRRRSAFQPRPSRLSVMAKAE